MPSLCNSGIPLLVRKCHSMFARKGAQNNSQISSQFMSGFRKRSKQSLLIRVPWRRRNPTNEKRPQGANGYAQFTWKHWEKPRSEYHMRVTGGWGCSPVVEHSRGLCGALGYIPRAKGRAGGRDNSRRVRANDVIPYSVEAGLYCSIPLHWVQAPVHVTSGSRNSLY